MSEALAQRLSAIALAGEEQLARLLDAFPLPLETARPARLLAAMAHGALDGGKRLRPFLVVESAALFGVDEQAALLTGCALEFVHCYSLIHDDLPAMDNDDTRRGRPTVHRAYDEATAILAGDSLLALAFDVLTREEISADATIRLTLVRELARLSGLGGMAGGQMLDLEAEGRFSGGQPLKLAEADIRTLQAMKTGALLRFAVRAGGLLGQASDQELAALDAYARHIGLAFQIADDLIDHEGDATAAGKAIGKDAAKGKGTLVSLHGADWAKAELQHLVEAADAALLSFGVKAEGLKGAARLIAFRRA
jgi:farnesyl diphosphate synthase